jgi:hypothetical protein
VEKKSLTVARPSLERKKIGEKKGYNFEKVFFKRCKRKRKKEKTDFTQLH